MKAARKYFADPKKPWAADFISLQESYSQFLEDVSNIPILDGILIKDEDLTSTTTNYVEHNLRRAYIGYIVVKQGQGDGVVYIPSGVDISLYPANKYLPLRFSGTDNSISLWVF